MTTPELLSLMRLLSAMESAMLAVGKSLPDHLWDEVTRHVQILEREILRRVPVSRSAPTASPKETNMTNPRVTQQG